VPVLHYGLTVPLVGDSINHEWVSPDPGQQKVVVTCEQMADWMYHFEVEVHAWPASGGPSVYVRTFLIVQDTVGCCDYGG
jgi:hypothetical protein